MAGRLENVVGALATAVSDAVGAATVASSGLGGAAPAALAALRAEPGLGMEALGSTVGVGGSGAVRLVDRLAAAGLVERRPGRDGRSVSVWLTRAGQDAAAAVLRDRSEVLAGALGVLTARERVVLEKLVEKVLAGLTTDRAHAGLICRLCDVDACPGASCPVEQAVP